MEHSAMARIQEGMRVVDATGDEVGKVEYVQDGDPEAVTLAGNEHRPTDLVDQIVQAALPDEAEPDVPDPLRSQLRRTGYVKIGGHGLLAQDRYVSSEQIGSVTADEVRLRVRKGALVPEE
jgi:hypothetical protein